MLFLSIIPFHIISLVSRIEVGRQRELPQIHLQVTLSPCGWPDGMVKMGSVVVYGCDVMFGS